MGCDVHLHVEIKVEGEWRHYNHPKVDRNYNLFSRMASVRNHGDIEPISLPRGLPEDVTFTTGLDVAHRGTDGHSHSYLDSAEIAELQEWAVSQEWGSGAFWFADTFGFLFGNLLEGFARYPDERLGFLEDVRFVFWFDN